MNVTVLAGTIGIILGAAQTGKLMIYTALCDEKHTHSTANLKPEIDRYTRVHIN